MPRKLVKGKAAKKAGKALASTGSTIARTRTQAHIEDDWGPHFIDAFRKTRSITAACAAVQKERSTPYKRRDRDEAFREAWDEIAAERKEALVDVMWRRAIEGDPEPLVVHDFVDEYVDSNGRSVPEDELDPDVSYRVESRRKTRLVPVIKHDTALQKFLAMTQMRELFGPSSTDEDDRERAARACAMLEEMRGSVPLWAEPDALEPKP